MTINEAAEREALKPCPWCNGIGVLEMDEEHGGWKHYGVSCKSCGNSPTPRYTDRSRSYDQYIYPHQSADEAIAAWNTRAHQAQQPSEVVERVAMAIKPWIEKATWSENDTPACKVTEQRMMLAAKAALSAMQQPAEPFDARESYIACVKNHPQGVQRALALIDHARKFGMSAPDYATNNRILSILKTLRDAKYQLETYAQQPTAPAGALTEEEISTVIKETAQCKLDFFDSQLRKPYLSNPDDIARALTAAMAKKAGT